MENKIRALVYGCSFVSVDNKDYCSVYVGQPAGDTRTYKGIEVMKMPASPEVFHTIGFTEFPQLCDLTINMKRVSGGSLGQVCVQLVPVNSPTQPKKAA